MVEIRVMSSRISGFSGDVHCNSMQRLLKQELSGSGLHETHSNCNIEINCLGAWLNCTSRISAQMLVGRMKDVFGARSIFQVVTAQSYPYSRTRL